MTTSRQHIGPRWMTLKQAVSYCPYGKASLIKMAKDGKIRGGQQTDKKKPAWFFDRCSIDEYMMSLCDTSHGNIQAMAQASLAKIRRLK